MSERQQALSRVRKKSAPGLVYHLLTDRVQGHSPAVVPDGRGSVLPVAAAELGEAASRDADVDRLSVNMQAVHRDAFAVRMKHRVRERRAVHKLLREQNYGLAA